MGGHMNYFISTLNFSSDSRNKISDTIPAMIAKGIRNIEISSLHPFEEHIEEKLLGFVQDNQVNILLHNFAPPTRESFLINLCDKEEKERKHVSDFIKERIVLTKKLHMDYYSFHAGFRVRYQRGIHEYSSRLSHKEAVRIFIEEVRDLVKFAEHHKVHLGVENHVTIKENIDNLLLYSKDDFETLFHEIDSKYLHLHLDLGHLKISSYENKFDKNEFIKHLGDKIYAMHVHDNTGIKVDCHAPFSENFWFGKDHLASLPNIKYLIFETKTYGNMELLGQMKGYMQKLMQEMIVL
jgi:sugar phosphate isomerase/epimerase